MALIPRIAFWITANLVFGAMPMASEPGFDCLGHAKEWEKSAELWKRAREQHTFLVRSEGETFVCPNRINAVKNACILRPILTRLRDTPKWKLPALGDLEVEIKTMYDKCGLSTGDKAVYQASVEVKKLTGLVSRKTKRKEVTKEKGQMNIWGLVVFCLFEIYIICYMCFLCAWTMEMLVVQH